MTKALIFCLQFYLAIIGYSTGAEIGIQNEVDGFRNFLQWKLSEYGSWLKSNGLDPAVESGPHVLRMSNSVVNLDIEIWDYYTKGLSEGWDIYADASLSNAYFSAYMFTLRQITFGGKYRANGTVVGTIPMNSNGDWTVVSNRFNQAGDYIYNITNGYVDLRGGSGWGDTIWNSLGTVQINFPGLVKDAAIAFEKTINDTVQGSIVGYIGRTIYIGGDPGYPGMIHLDTYMRGIFQSATFFEIIGTTDPPTATTPGWPEEPITSETETTDIITDVTTDPPLWTTEEISTTFHDPSSTTVGTTEKTSTKATTTTPTTPLPCTSDCKHSLNYEERIELNGEALELLRQHFGWSLRKKRRWFLSSNVVIECASEPGKLKRSFDIE